MAMCYLLINLTCGQKRSIYISFVAIIVENFAEKNDMLSSKQKYCQYNNK